MPIVGSQYEGNHEHPPERIPARLDQVAADLPRRQGRGVLSNIGRLNRSTLNPK
jgi:hypothetical protein